MLVRTNLVPQQQYPRNVPSLAAPLLTSGPRPVAVPAQVQVQVEDTGLSFGTFLAIGSSLWSTAVMFDPKASREQKALAQMVLGIALPYALKPVFEQQAWPRQWN